jgi:S-adenosylmethionine-diacylglycerol 3-amino-3-carboxypropyl transferase
MHSARPRGTGWQSSGLEIEEVRVPHPLHVDERYPSGDRARALTDEPVRYSQVWEDHDVLRRALAIAHGADVLSICGAGCNVLSLLLEEPRSVVAVDVNPAQTALLELKLVALRRLSHGEFAAFLGARIAVDREATYERLRADLGRDARAYWDEHPVEIHGGVLCSGSLDRHVRAFAEECVATQVDPAAVVAFLELSSPELQRAAFTRDLAVLERPARTWFGRARLLAEWARHGAQFRRAGSVDVGEVFWHRFVEVATTVPASSNF